MEDEVVKQKMKDMKLHEKMTVGGSDIQRVIGGWIYWVIHDGTVETNKGVGVSCSVAGVFVPEP